ncbi:MAG: flagellar biosynthetic protein FliO [Kofleriaceae bacterium]
MRAPEAAAQAATGGGYAGLLLSTVLLLVAVSVIAYVAVRLLRRGLEGRAVGAQLVTVLARTPLEPRRALYVVQVGGKTLLLGASEGGLALLTELDQDALPAQPAAGASRFAELLAAAWGKRRSPAVGPSPDDGDMVPPAGSA